MAKKRRVERACSTFDLTIGKEINLTRKLKTRIMLIYDQKQNQKDFIVLDRKIPQEINGRIRAWLDHHVDVVHILHGSNENHIYAEEMAAPDVFPGLKEAI